MRIAVINLTSRGMSGGYKKYWENVIPRMAKLSNVEALLCATPQSVNIQDWIEKLPNVEFVNCRPFSPFHNSPDSKLREHLNRFSPDVIFVPTERSFSFYGVPVVNMIQNMEPLVYPYKDNPLSEKIRNWLRMRETKKATYKADRLIAVSKFVHDFLIEQRDISDDRIEIVHHGIDLSKNIAFKRPEIIPSGWEKNFLFTAGSIRPARGLEDAFLAMESLFINKVDIAGLVIAGSTDSAMTKYRKQLERKIRSYKINNHVCWVGNLNEQEMTWCYKNCLMFLMTSRVESFGIVALEAMSHGCICISSNSPCLPEIFGDAAIYYTAENAKALTKAIQHVLSMDFNKRKGVSESAKKRAAQFSWDICTDKTLLELKRAIETFKQK